MNKSKPHAYNWHLKSFLQLLNDRSVDGRRLHFGWLITHFIRTSRDFDAATSFASWTSRVYRIIEGYSLILERSDKTRGIQVWGRLCLLTAALKCVLNLAWYRNSSAVGSFGRNRWAKWFRFGVVQRPSRPMIVIVMADRSSRSIIDCSCASWPHAGMWAASFWQECQQSAFQPFFLWISILTVAFLALPFFSIVKFDAVNDSALTAQMLSLDSWTHFVLQQQLLCSQGRAG